MKKMLMLSAFVGLVSIQPAAQAATGSATFSGAVTATCVLTAGVNGVITPNSDYTNLSSTNALGSASTISALATGLAFKVSTDAPTGVAGDVLSSKYTLSGATTSPAQVSGSTQTTLNPGVTNVAVDMSATKTTGVYAAGVYLGVVTVRCE